MFYDIELASVLAFAPKIAPKTPYNGLFLRLYGLIWGSQKVWTLRGGEGAARQCGYLRLAFLLLL